MVLLVLTPPYYVAFSLFLSGYEIFQHLSHSTSGNLSRSFWNSTSGSGICKTLQSMDRKRRILNLICRPDWHPQTGFQMGHFSIDFWEHVAKYQNRVWIRKIRFQSPDDSHYFPEAARFFKRGLVGQFFSNDRPGCVVRHIILVHLHEHAECGSSVITSLRLHLYLIFVQRNYTRDGDLSVKFRVTRTSLLSELDQPTPGVHSIVLEYSRVSSKV